MDKALIKLEEARRDADAVTRADLAILQAVEPLADHPLIDAVGEAAELADQPPLIIASLATLATGLALRRPGLARAGIGMLGAHLAATGIKTLIKDKISRPRPDIVCEDGEHYLEKDDSDENEGEEKSFPSGHSAGAVAVARALVREYPGAAPVAYPLAATAALIQIPRMSHFPSDVMAGSIIGLIAERLSSAVLRRLMG